MRRNNFIQTIKLLQDNEKRQRKIDTFSYETFGDYLPNFNEDMITGILNVLKDEMNDSNDIIGWWLYDAPEGINGNPAETHMWDVDGNPIEIVDAGQLWDYLTKE